jgi:hypothetical protein
MSKNRKFNKKAFIILLCGISIQIAGWFGEHCVEIPFVLRFVAPDYYHARNGLETLLSKHSIGTFDDGFKQLSPFALKYFRQQVNVATNITDLRITNLILATTYSPNSEAHLATSMVVMYFTTSQAKIIGNNIETMQFDRLKDDAESLREPNIIVFCFALFFIGTLIDVFSFFVESKEASDDASDDHAEQTAKTSDKADDKDICATTHADT